MNFCSYRKKGNGYEARQTSIIYHRSSSRATYDRTTKLKSRIIDSPWFHMEDKVLRLCKLGVGRSLICEVFRNQLFCKRMYRLKNPGQRVT